MTVSKNNCSRFFKKEEHLSTKLQELYEREKESSKTLKHSSESVNESWVQIASVRECERMKELERQIEKESELRGRLKEAGLKLQGFAEVA